MKKYFPIFLALFFTATAFALPESESKFTVTGVGRVYYAPEYYDMAYNVITEGADVQECKVLHMGTLGKVKGFMDKKYQSIVSFKKGVTQLETLLGNDQSTVVHYRYVTPYVIRLKDDRNLMDIQEGLIVAGASRVLYMKPYTSRTSDLLEDARKAAFKDAKEKAEIAASNLGWLIVGAADVTFQESDTAFDESSENSFAMDVYKDAVDTRPGASEFVQSQVSVTFIFDEKKN